MSDSEESTQTMHPMQKRPRPSIVSQNDDSGDETDDVSSTVSTLLDDSQSDTPTNSTHNRSKSKLNRLKPKPKFKCTNFLKEDHKKPIFGVHFNPFRNENDPLLFITVGHNRVTLYESMDGGKIKLLQAYADPSTDENYYCGTWTYDKDTGQPLICVGGLRGIIRVIGLVAQQCIKHFIGHGSAVNELKIHPYDHNMLLSVSRDNTMRLWNIKTSVCVAIFGGVDGHRDEVLSADFNIHGTKLISCGMDHSLKMWRTDKESLKNAMDLSYVYNAANTKETPFPSHDINFPDFSTRDVHRNYVDCVRWLGNFVLSKSCENCIICWKPGNLEDTEDKQWKGKEGKVSILHRFEYKECDIWYMRFSLDHQQKASSRDQQRVGSEDGKKKARECMRKRRMFRDVASIDMLDRIDSLCDPEWASSEIQLQKYCYSSFTSEMHIQRLQKQELSKVSKARLFLVLNSNSKSISTLKVPLNESESNESLSGG